MDLVGGTLPASLTINSRRYGAWSLRGWLLCKFADFSVDVIVQSSEDASARAELLLLSPSFLVPCLRDDEVAVWGPAAIAEYLHETCPKAEILPNDAKRRAHCRSISGEMQSGFHNLRAALPMNIGAHHPGFSIWGGAKGDIARIEEIWQDCLSHSGGPYLFGDHPTLADAMFAPVCSRFSTYEVDLAPDCVQYRDFLLTLPAMVEWTTEASKEPDEIHELDVEF